MDEELLGVEGETHEIEMGRLKNRGERFDVVRLTGGKHDEARRLTEAALLLVLNHEARIEQRVLASERLEVLGFEETKVPAVRRRVEGQRGVLPLQAQLPDDAEVLGLLIDELDLVDPDPDADLADFAWRLPQQQRFQRVGRLRLARAGKTEARQTGDDGRPTSFERHLAHFPCFPRTHPCRFDLGKQRETSGQCTGFH